MRKPDWNKGSALWGGAVTGLIVGVIWGFIKDNFSHTLRAVLIGGLVGLTAEVLGRVGDRLRRGK